MSEENNMTLQLDWHKFLFLIIAIGWFGFVLIETSNLTSNMQIQLDLVWVLGVTCLYYAVAWFFVGRDPKRETVIPRHQPPGGLSPAACHYLYYLSHANANVMFFSALLNLSVKKFIQIHKADDTQEPDSLLRDEGYLIKRLKKASQRDLAAMPDDERHVVEKIINKKEVIGFRKNKLEILEAYTFFTHRVRHETNSIYFNSNHSYLLGGLILLILTFFAALKNAALHQWSASWVVGICFVSVTAVPMLYYLFVRSHYSIKAWVSHYRPYRSEQKFSKYWRAYFKLLAPPALLIIVTSLYFSLFDYMLPLNAAALLVGIIYCNIIFEYLLQAPTLKYAGIRSEIDGFRLYLKTAEAERITQTMDQQEATKLFERYLPYALALGVENEWSHSFKKILTQIHASRPRVFVAERDDWFILAAEAITLIFIFVFAFVMSELKHHLLYGESSFFP